MNKLLIIFSILVVSIIAYTDARDRLNELDEVAANTPAQVEMKPIFHNNSPENKFENPTNNTPQMPKQVLPTQNNEQTNSDFKPNVQKIDNFKQKRNSDIFK